MTDLIYLNEDELEARIERIQDDYISRCSVEDNKKICKYMNERFKTVYDMEF